MSVSLTNPGVTYTQDFNTLAATGTSSALPTGWVLLETGTNANTLYSAGTGSSSTGDTYSFGSASASDRALGMLLSGALTPSIGASFTNATGSAITALTISYVGEMWRAGVTNRGAADRLDFQYSTSATSLASGGSWTNVDELDFLSPVTSVTAGSLDGNNAANRTSLSHTISGLDVQPGATIWIRWVDFNIASADDGLAIDDLSLTPVTTAPTQPVVSITAPDSAASESGSDPGMFRFTRTGDNSSPLVVGYTIGGSASSADYTPALTGSFSFPAGQSVFDLSITPVDDTLVEGPETVVLTLQAAAGYSVGGSTATVTIADNDTAAVRIANVQGAAHQSPLVGQAVANVPGIVTAVVSNGFYLQDPQPDANPATSDGIFVFTSSAPTVAVGAAVRVSGTVSEFRAGGAENLSVTQIVSPIIITDSTGNPLPAAIVIGQGGRVPPSSIISNDAEGGNVENIGTLFDPAEDGIDFWESLEGMRVQVNNPVATSPTTFFPAGGGTNEEIWILADGGAGATGRTERGGSLISANDFNPERIQIDDLTLSVTLPTVDVGARLSTITGVVNYAFSNYEVLVAEAPTAVTPSTLTREVSALTPGAGQLTVATFNVENLDPGDGAAKFNALAAAIVANLRAPDILSMSEVQDNNGSVNNGVTDAAVTLQTLVDAISAAGGPTYQWRQLDPVNNQDGGEPGGNIRVAFLFNPARVEFVEGSLQRLTDTTPADGDALAASRKPLVGDFTFNGETVTLIGNHLNSKGPDQPLFGVNQPPALTSEVQRLQQADILKGFVEGKLAVNPQAKVILLGDLNDFEFSAPLTRLESAGLTTLIEALPSDQRYTYNFEGNAQALDHILVSSSLAGALDGIDVVRINSEFAVQVSDHDPVLARFSLGAGQTLTGTLGRDQLAGGGGNDVITGGGGRDLISTGGGSDRIVFTGLIDFFDVVTDFTRGQDKIDIGVLLASVGYAGSNPVADGLLQFVTPSVPLFFGGSVPLGTLVQFDADGSAGPEAARPMVYVVGVALDTTDFLVGGL